MVAGQVAMPDDTRHRLSTASHGWSHRRHARSKCSARLGTRRTRATIGRRSGGACPCGRRRSVSLPVTGTLRKPTAAEIACDRPDGPPLPDSLRPGCHSDAPAARFGESRGRSRQIPQCPYATRPPRPANGSPTAPDIAERGTRPLPDRNPTACSAGAGARWKPTIGDCDTPMMRRSPRPT